MMRECERIGNNERNVELKSQKRNFEMLCESNSVIGGDLSHAHFVYGTVRYESWLMRQTS